MPTAVVGSLIGAGASLIAGSRAASAQNKATDVANAAAQRADQLSREQFDWNRSIYERDVAPAQRENQRLQREIADESLAASRQQRDFATRQRQEYEDTFLPNERRVVADANSYDSDANVGRRSGMAAANVNQQFSNANAQKARLLTRFGLNPNSSAFAREAGKSATAQAAASAGAQTGAAFDTMDRAIALRAGAANLGRNLPNTAAQFGNLGNNSSSIASGASGSAGSALSGGIGMMNNAFDSRGSSIINSGALSSRALSGSASAWGNVAQGLGNMTGQMINSAGGWSGLSGGLRSFFGMGPGSNAAGAAVPLGMQSDGFSPNPQYGA